MGTWGTFVASRSDRDLGTVPVLAQLVDAGEIEPEMGWRRSDGWQLIFSPALPEKDLLAGEVAVETGAPALVVRVADSDCLLLEASSTHGSCHLVLGHTEGLDADELNAQELGEPWQPVAARRLAEWVGPTASPDLGALELALTAERVFAERAVYDILSLLGLAQDAPWWTELPGCAYAFEARGLHVLYDVPEGIDIGWTGAEVGVWTAASTTGPDRTFGPHGYEAAINHLMP